jgi:ribosomal protein L29
LVCVTGNQVEAKAANESTRKDAQAQLANEKAQLFDVQMQRAIPQAEPAST